MAVLGAAAAAAMPQITITDSMTWTPPMDGNVCIHAIGGGGGGTGTGNTYYCQGGNAGGYSRYNKLAVTTSNNLTIVIGAGGLGKYGTVAGAAGGNTTVAWTSPSSVTMYAYGGGGGSSSTTLTYGGSASGGDVNYSGGSSSWNCSSGACVGIYGTGAAGTTNDVGTTKTTPDSAGGGLSMSAFGVIVGGKNSGGQQRRANATGSSSWLQASNWSQATLDGDDLMGGGSNSDANSWYVAGGNGGIGAGGGAAVALSSTYAYGGRGGDGIVIIQYIPW